LIETLKAALFEHSRCQERRRVEFSTYEFTIDISHFEKNCCSTA